VEQTALKLYLFLEAAAIFSPTNNIAGYFLILLRIREQIDTVQRKSDNRSIYDMNQL